MRKLLYLLVLILLCLISACGNGGGEGKSFAEEEDIDNNIRYVDITTYSQVPAKGYASFKVNLQDLSSIESYTWNISENCGVLHGKTEIFKILETSESGERKCILEFTATGKFGDIYKARSEFDLTEGYVEEILDGPAVISSKETISGTPLNISLFFDHLITKEIFLKWQIDSSCGNLSGEKFYERIFNPSDLDIEKICLLTAIVSSNKFYTILEKEIKLLKKPDKTDKDDSAMFNEGYILKESAVTNSFKSEEIIWQKLPSKNTTIRVKENNANITITDEMDNDKLFIKSEGINKEGFFKRSTVNNTLKYYKSGEFSIILPYEEDGNGLHKCFDYYEMSPISLNVHRKTFAADEDYVCLSKIYETDNNYIYPDIINDLYSIYESVANMETGTFNDDIPFWKELPNTADKIEISESWIKHKTYYKNSAPGFFERSGKDVTAIRVSFHKYIIPYDLDINGKFRCLDMFEKKGLSSEDIRRVTYSIPGYTACFGTLYDYEDY